MDATPAYELTRRESIAVKPCQPHLLPRRATLAVVNEFFRVDLNLSLGRCGLLLTFSGAMLC
jgi:hypothetical protein